MGSIKSHYNGFGVVSLPFVSFRLHVFRMLLNITHQNGPPGTTRSVRALVLCPAALFIAQLYIETEYARFSKTLENFEHFSDNHVFGRMNNKCFQTVTCGNFQNLIKPVQAERYHSREVLRHIIQPYRNFLSVIYLAQNQLFPPFRNSGRV